MMDVVKAIEIIGHVQHDSLGEAKDVLRAAVRRLAAGSTSDLELPACSRLLWRKSWEFRVQGAALDAEFRALTKLLAATSDRDDHEAQVLHSQAQWLFERHGSKRTKEAQRLMDEAAQKGRGYKAFRHHVPVGVACEAATKELAAGKGAPLLYLMLQQYAEAHWDHSPSPWLLQAISNPKFWSWLQRQKKRPRVPSEFADLEVDRLFARAPTKFKHLSWWKCWPTGRREVLAALQLLSPKEKLPIDVAFQNMAALGDTDAMEFLSQGGIETKVISRAAKQAALHGQVKSLYCLNELGLNQRGKAGALRSVCREGEEPASHRYQPRMGELAERRDGAVIDALIDMGAVVKLDRVLSLALDAHRTEAVVCLLRHGADPEKFRELVKTQGAQAERFYSRHPETAPLLT